MTTQKLSLSYVMTSVPIYLSSTSMLSPVLKNAENGQFAAYERQTEQVITTTTATTTTFLLQSNLSIVFTSSSNSSSNSNNTRYTE